MRNYDTPVEVLTQLLTDEKQNGLKIARALQTYFGKNTELTFEQTIKSNSNKH